jgi:hypothetical protein
VLYAKNCLICHTDERLIFYTMRRPDLFAADNSNQFPEPVVDVKGIREKGNDDPIVYIFDDTKKIYSAMQDRPRALSNSASI